MKTSTRQWFQASIGTALSALILLVAIVLCSPVYAQSDGVSVTLLVYSGRENPQIELGAEELSQLRAFVSDLAENSQFRKDSVTPSILGYSGFVVKNKGKASGLPEYLAVYGADVEASGAEGRRFYRDENRNIENWMVQRFMARDLIEDQALKMIRSAH